MNQACTTKSDYQVEDDTGSEDHPLLLSGPTHGTKHENSTYSSCSAFMIFIFPALGGLLFGYDIGATSAVIQQLKSEDYSGVKWYGTVAESSVVQGIITSLTMFGALLGCVIGFRAADELGRRRSILIAAVAYFFGSIIEWLSGNSSWDALTGISVLAVGRILYGVGVGFAMQGAPAYIGEMAPASIRGLLVSLKEVFIVLGMLVGYSVGYAYSELRGGWRITYGWASVLAVVMFAGMYHLPFSAPWLAMQGKLDAAVASLRFVTAEPTAEQIRSLKKLSTQAAAAVAGAGAGGVTVAARKPSLRETYAQLTAPTVWPAMVAGVGMVTFQQITGQPSVLYYADSIFADIGISSVASIAISSFKLVATLLTTFTVDRYGRKKLLYIGCALMLVALVALGVSFSFSYMNTAECNSHLTHQICPSSCVWDTHTVQCNLEPACPSTEEVDGTATRCECCTVSGLDAQKSAILLSLFLYIGGYQVGFGPIVWLLISEIFPLEVRGRAVAVAVIANFLLNTVTALLFPVELAYLGPATTFFVFAGVLVASVFFIHKHVPETKGLSLEEIERFFAVGAEARQAEVPGSGSSSSSSSSWGEHQREAEREQGSNSGSALSPFSVTLSSGSGGGSGVGGERGSGREDRHRRRKGKAVSQEGFLSEEEEVKLMEIL